MLFIFHNILGSAAVMGPSQTGGQTVQYHAVIGNTLFLQLSQLNVFMLAYITHVQQWLSLWDFSHMHP